MIPENKLKEYKQSIASITEKILTNPDDVKLYILRGSAYCYLGEFDKAIADCDEAIRINPNDLRARMQRSVAVTLKGHRANKV